MVAVALDSPRLDGTPLPLPFIVIRRRGREINGTPPKRCHDGTRKRASRRRCMHDITSTTSGWSVLCPSLLKKFWAGSRRTAATPSKCGPSSSPTSDDDNHDDAHGDDDDDVDDDDAI